MLNLHQCLVPSSTFAYFNFRKFVFLTKTSFLQFRDAPYEEAPPQSSAWNFHQAPGRGTWTKGQLRSWSFCFGARHHRSWCRDQGHVEDAGLQQHSRSSADPAYCAPPVSEQAKLSNSFFHITNMSVTPFSNK